MSVHPLRIAIFFAVLSGAVSLVALLLDGTASYAVAASVLFVVAILGAPLVAAPTHASTEHERELAARTARAH
jgi:hypothetical protein